MGPPESTPVLKNSLKSMLSCRSAARAAAPGRTSAAAPRNDAVAPRRNSPRLLLVAHPEDDASASSEATEAARGAVARRSAAKAGEDGANAAAIEGKRNADAATAAEGRAWNRMAVLLNLIY
uniref:Uncharacterized protein n=1 Tax=Odontella aurita TaxID=265563 RepID=A0A7S4JR24_9STRA